MMFWLPLMALLVILVFSLKYAWWRPAIDYRIPRILMYHMVSEHREGARFNKLRVPPGQFERQIRWLVESGWHFARMADLVAGKPLPAKTLVLTFDDGYRDNYLHAHPVLMRYGGCATLYLVVDRFDRDWSSYKKAHHDSGELMREEKLTDTEVRAMLADGCWELGGHTLTHANLPRLDPQQRREEICACRGRLEEMFDVPVETFAYPFGLYEPQDRDWVRDCGYTTAVTTRNGLGEGSDRDPLELPRVKISGKDSMLSFRIRLRTGQRGLI